MTAEIHARSLVNFYCQYADRHMNLNHATRQRLMRLLARRDLRRVSERDGNSEICYRKKQIDVSF